MVWSLFVSLQVPEGEEMAPARDGDPEEAVSSLQRKLEEEVASECPRNGEIAIRMIEMAFIDAKKDKEELGSWAIHLNSL